MPPPTDTRVPCSACTHVHKLTHFATASCNNSSGDRGVRRLAGLKMGLSSSLSLLAAALDAESSPAEQRPGEQGPL